MGDFHSWLQGNWFNIVQTAGIVGSLCLAAGAAIREAKAREVENLLTIADHHRELWKPAYERRELKRVLSQQVDVQAVPITPDEEGFINAVIVHFLTGWRIAKAGGITTPNELAEDAREFFSFPLPHAVWQKTKGARNPRFVRFVERALVNK
jgi:hypothetical protein